MLNLPWGIWGNAGGLKEALRCTGGVTEGTLGSCSFLVSRHALCAAGSPWTPPTYSWGLQLGLQLFLCFALCKGLCQQQVASAGGSIYPVLQRALQSTLT